MPPIELSAVRNFILAALSPDVLAKLVPHLQQIDLTDRSVIYRANEPIVAVLFPSSGYVSLLTPLEDGDAAEVGLVGREGIVGLPIALGSDRSSVEALVQGEGTGLQMNGALFRQAMEDEVTLRDVVLRYVLAFTMQVTMTAACNGRHQIEQRLSRWLLMAHDRMGHDEFRMTHEFLSMMLGVRRAGVTVAAGILQKAGLIQYDRGRVRIVDRTGLEASACECHEIVSREYVRLMGQSLAKQ